jgi:hypothetical protein
MRAALAYVPSSKAQLRGPMVTCCGHVTDRLIRTHGLGTPPSCCARSWSPKAIPAN